MLHLKKRLLVFLFSLTCLFVSGATYYVAPWGKDTNPGTTSLPFFTLNKVWTVVAAGDLVYMRGGTYVYTSQQNLSGKNGVSGNLIKVWAYPGETPVITRGSSWSWNSYKVGIVFSGNWVHFKGLELTGFYQEDSYVWGSFRAQNFNNCIIESINSHHNGGPVYLTGNSTGNLVLNCDFHHQYDPLTDGASGPAYNNADGLNIEGVYAGSTNTVRGCRAWANSDDGFDYYSAEGLIITENCWAWDNGFTEDGTTVGGDGCGFKLGGASGTAMLRTVKNCLSFVNAAWGFSENEANCNMEIYNNTSYANNQSGVWGGGYHFNISGVPYYIKNNISFNDGRAADLLTYTNVSYNSWDGGYSVTSADFVSTSTAGVDGARLSDGSLPDLSFMKLATGSDLIDAGINVGIPIKGASPDLGAFETQSTTSVPVPVYSGAVVENSTPTSLVMTYNLSLTNIVPAASAFTVKVNSTTRTVTAVAISGAKVILTLSSAVVYGNVITVAYTKPATNPIQTVSGGMAVSITAQPVTNNCLAVTPTIPVYSGSVIKNTAPSVIEMSYNLSLASITPAVSAFTVLVNSVSRPVTLVTVSGTKVLLTLSSSVVYGDNVTLAYTKPTVNQIQTSSGGQAATFSAQSVTNSVANGSTGLIVPVYINSLVGDAYPKLVRLSFDQILSNIIPAASSFTVKVNSVVRTISSVSISGVEVILTLNAPVLYNDIVTVSYTKPSVNALQAVSTAQVATFAEKAVTNECLQISDPVDDASGELKIQVYPNPASQFINVSIVNSLLSSKVLRIYDLNGKVLMTEVIEQNATEILLPLNLQTGIYIITIESNKLILHTQKLIISN